MNTRLKVPSDKLRKKGKLRINGKSGEEIPKVRNNGPIKQRLSRRASKNCIKEIYRLKFSLQY